MFHGKHVKSRQEETWVLVFKSHLSTGLLSELIKTALPVMTEVTSSPFQVCGFLKSCPLLFIHSLRVISQTDIPVG